MRIPSGSIGWVVLALLSGAACQSLEFDPIDGGGGSEAGGETVGTGEAPPPESVLANEPLAESSSSDLSPPGADLGELFEPESLCADASLHRATTVRRSLSTSLGTSSATWARAMLRAGRRPEASRLRVDDFLALYAPPPVEEGGRVALHLRALDVPLGGEGGGGGPVGKGAWDPIDVIARVDTPSERTEPLRIVLLVDVSPSMRAVTPLVSSVVDTFLSGLDQTDDALAVVSFAGEARVEVPFGPIADVAPAVASLQLLPRPGGDLSAALRSAYELRSEGEPLHVLLLTDGEKRLDESLVALVDTERQRGAHLSVALLGKPVRAGVDPQVALSFPQRFGETLARSGGGQAHYLAEVGDVVDVLGGRGIDRRFGVALRSGALSVSLSRFLQLEVAEALSGEASPEAELAPGWSYGFHLPGSVCSADVLRSTPEMLLTEAYVALEGKEQGAPLYQAYPSTASDIALDAVDLIETAVVAAVGALRGADAIEALGRLDAVEAALGCELEAEARGCPAVDELRELVLLHGAASPPVP